MLNKTIIYGVCPFMLIAGLFACERRSEMEQPTSTTVPGQAEPEAQERAPAAQAEQPSTAPQAQQQQQQQQQPAEGAQGAEGRQAVAQQAGDIKSITDVTGNPTQFMGQKVTIRGAVEETYGQRGFKLEDDAVTKGEGDDDLIVLGAKDASWDASKEWGKNPVSVTGTLRRVTVANLEKDLGWKPESDIKEALEDETYALVAESVVPAPQR